MQYRKILADLRQIDEALETQEDKVATSLKNISAEVTNICENVDAAQSKIETVVDEIRSELRDQHKI